MGNISIREYKETDIDRCVELLSKIFPGRSDRATFGWRFQDNYQKKPILIVAEDNQKIISFNSWLPWEFSYNGETYLGYQSGESATLHEYRGKGIWEKVFILGQKVAFERGIDFLFGFPNEMSYGGAIKAGYFPIGTFCFFLRPVNIFNRREEGLKKTIPNVSSHLIISQNNIICPKFDNEYCKWRYIDNTKDYDIIEYSEKSSWSIFIIRRRKWRTLNEAILLDCQFNNYNNQFIENAIKYIDNILTRRVVYMRTFFNEHSERGKLLSKYFYLKVKTKQETLMVKPISEKMDLKILMNWLKWDIMPHCVDEY